MDTYFRNVLAFLSRIDEASVSGLLDRDLIVEANKLRLETQLEIGRTRVHGAEFMTVVGHSLDVISHSPPDLTEDRR